MKQNEKILVYAVTGFLVVILAIAILFGKEAPGRVPGDLQRSRTATAPRSLEDIMNERAGLPPIAVDDATQDPAGTPLGGDDAPAQEPAGLDGASLDGTGRDRANQDPAGASESGSDGAETRPTTGQPLVANVQLLPPTPAALVTEKLGLNRTERGFRIVRARPGDTLGTLVQKWCGSLDHLEEAQGLNETLTTLRVGQDVVLPWIEDEVLLAALADREADRAAGRSAQPLDAAVQPGRMQATPAATTPMATTPAATPASAAVRTYTIKAGDSLWKIGEREVGSKQVPSYLQRVRELNPGLDTDRIREGQEIRLPAKS
ncbi:MAG: LysM peptidoglycan-binding domain-containing protein [Planctomycetota bacterium]